MKFPKPMKIRYLDQQDKYDGELIGAGTKLVNIPCRYKRFRSAWMWVIYHAKIKLGWTNNYLIVFDPKCIIADCEQWAKAQIAMPKSENSGFFLSHLHQTFVLESCSFRKLPHVLQSAFPDAYFAWKPPYAQYYENKIL